MEKTIQKVDKEKRICDNLPKYSKLELQYFVKYNNIAKLSEVL